MTDIYSICLESNFVDSNTDDKNILQNAIIFIIMIVFILGSNEIILVLLVELIIYLKILLNIIMNLLIILIVWIIFFHLLILFV